MTDSSQSYDTHRFTGKFDQGVIPETEIGAGYPFALFHLLAMVPYPMAEFKQKGKDILGDSSGPIGWDVGDNDAMVLGRCNINDIETGCKYSDIFDRWTGFELSLAKRCLVRQDNLGIPDSLDNLFFFRAVVYGNFPKGTKAIPGQIAGVKGESIKYYYLHIISSPIDWVFALIIFLYNNLGIF
jgi:hypothetical protein